MDALVLGLSLGLGAGVSPGPLLALVVRSTLQGGFRAGVRVACSPLVTDVPIITFAVVLASSLPTEALGVLGIAGGGFVVFLGVEALRDAPTPVEAAAGGGGTAAHRDLLRGALTNVLSPHPWVFWIAVGAPILGDNGVGGSALFLVAFFGLLIGTKVAVAAMLHAGRERLLQGSGYRIVLRASALLLLVTGAVLLADGIGTLG